MEKHSLRGQVFSYVQNTYQSAVEYPWARFPEYAVFRHKDNRKWYGLVMNVLESRLGKTGGGYVDILNVKLGDPFLKDLLTAQDGYFSGYHFGRGDWISILLDGTVPFEEITRWIDTSYQVTASKAKKEKLRPPKEWLVPANPRYYDIEHAFDRTDTIDWKQGRGIINGDTVDLYAAAPISAILFQCRVIETGIPYEYEDEDLTITALMKLTLLKRFAPERFPFAVLKETYGVAAVRGPRGVPNRLSEALKDSPSFEEPTKALRSG